MKIINLVKSTNKILLSQKKKKKQKTKNKTKQNKTKQKQKQHTSPSGGTRILSLMLYTLRDWAWFTAIKSG